MSSRVISPNRQMVENLLRALHPEASAAEITARMDSYFDRIARINSLPNPQRAFEQALGLGRIRLMTDPRPEAAVMASILPQLEAKLMAMGHQGASIADLGRSFETAITTCLNPGLSPCARVQCLAAGIKKCSACKKVFYCSEACQIACWPEHKKVCVITPQPSAAK